MSLAEKSTTTIEKIRNGSYEVEDLNNFLDYLFVNYREIEKFNEAENYSNTVNVIAAMFELELIPEHRKEKCAEMGFYIASKGIKDFNYDLGRDFLTGDEDEIKLILNHWIRYILVKITPTEFYQFIDDYNLSKRGDYKESYECLLVYDAVKIQEIANSSPVVQMLNLPVVTITKDYLEEIGFGLFDNRLYHGDDVQRELFYHCRDNFK